METGGYFVNVDDHFLQQPLLVWSTNFVSKKKTEKVHTGRGGVGVEVSFRLRSVVFLPKKMVDHTKRHDKIFPDFYTLSSIITQ